MDCNREEGERGRPPSSKDEAPGRHGRKPNARTMECPLASVLSQFAFLVLSQFAFLPHRLQPPGQRRQPLAQAVETQAAKYWERGGI